MESLDQAGLTSAQKDELMERVRQQMAIANAQELLAEMSKKCFNKCIIKPGSTVDSTEQKCVAMCMDRFMESWNIVSRTYSKRIESEHQN